MSCSSETLAMRIMGLESISENCDMLDETLDQTFLVRIYLHLV
jgi:hypothetical protein